MDILSSVIKSLSRRLSHLFVSDYRNIVHVSLTSIGLIMLNNTLKRFFSLKIDTIDNFWSLWNVSFSNHHQFQSFPIAIANLEACAVLDMDASKFQCLQIRPVSRFAELTYFFVIFTFLPSAVDTINTSINLRL